MWGWDVGLQWLKSGKYKQAIMKGYLIIGLHGLILKHSAHLGVDNDTGVMETIMCIMEEDGRADCDDGDEDAMWELDHEEGEWGLGDKAYCMFCEVGSCEPIRKATRLRWRGPRGDGE